MAEGVKDHAHNRDINRVAEIARGEERMAVGLKGALKTEERACRRRGIRALGISKNGRNK